MLIGTSSSHTYVHNGLEYHHETLDRVSKIFLFSRLLVLNSLIAINVSGHFKGVPDTSLIYINPLMMEF